MKKAETGIRLKNGIHSYPDNLNFSPYPLFLIPGRSVKIIKINQMTAEDFILLLILIPPMTVVTGMLIVKAVQIICLPFLLIFKIYNYVWHRKS